ncbi:MAG: ankyrin repeat protein [Edafosvirus sp.]|uniref:Ankyrin repeat protein n=1 Tax=Edafosvirus sp. TaxID=2487765 RepID=A0A3G4ZWT6_9VIRU|nr:MAG: ankyrin repeat protein [Edafosvirus sp.]
MNYIDYATSASNNKHTGVGSEDSATSPFQKGGFFWDQNAPSQNAPSNNDAKLLKACHEKDFNVVRFMILNDMVSDYCYQDEHGCTVLHCLAYNYSSIPEADKLVDKILSSPKVKNFINIQEKKNGDTALIIAVKQGNTNLAEKLIKKDKTGTSIKNFEGLHVGEFDKEGNIPTDTANVNTDVEDVEDLSNNTELQQEVEKIVKLFVGLNKKAKASIDSTANLPESINITETFVKKPVAAVQQLPQETEQFFKMLDQRYKQGIATQMGGDKTVSLGQRELKTYSESSVIGGAKSKSKKINNGNDEEDSTEMVIETESDSPKNLNRADVSLSRMLENQAEEIHKRTIQKIMEIMKVDEKVARNYKAAIYKMAKEKYPEASNLNRAIEMEKLATKKVLDGIDIDQVTSDIEKHLSEKEKNKPVGDKPKKDRRESKKGKDTNSDKKPEKPKRKSKKSSEENSETSPMRLSPTSAGDDDNDNMPLSETSV